MHAERKFRNAFQAVWAAEMNPIRKARCFLVFARRAQKIGTHLMNLGFLTNLEEDRHKRKRLWAGAAQFLNLAVEARENGRRALAGQSQSLGFGYSPCGYAVPDWDLTTRLPKPQEVTV